MEPSILVLNVGSSSLKFACYGVHGEQLHRRLQGQIADLHGAPYWQARNAAGQSEHAPISGDPLQALLEVLEQRGHRFAAVGHRVVHGGLKYADAQRIDATVLDELTGLIALAPLHQPHNLAAIRHIAQLQPTLPQVACFDTAFHRNNADLVQRYALPDALHQQGVRRYGFHGLSYAYIAQALTTIDARAATGKTIVLHLGNGASLCALQGGVSIASSMGFSALDGIPMATRCGALDPGVILHLLSQGADSAALEDLLYRRSGLLGVSGLSGDMRVLGESDETLAKVAIDLYVYRIQREIGSLMAALGGLDALVFTAGIGENAHAVRAQILAGLDWLGVCVDPAANLRHGPLISSKDSRVSALVIATDEEVVIARQTLKVLGSLNAGQ